MAAVGGVGLHAFRQLYTTIVGHWVRRLLGGSACAREGMWQDVSSVGAGVNSL